MLERKPGFLEKFSVSVAVAYKKKIKVVGLLFMICMFPIVRYKDILQSVPNGIASLFKVRVADKSTKVLHEEIKNKIRLVCLDG